MRNSTGKRPYWKALATIVLGMLPALTALADDTEIYFTDLPGDQGLANVLFILDYSGSMARNPVGDELANGADDYNSRYQIMRRVFNNVAANLPNSISAGLMTYGGQVKPTQGDPILAEPAHANGVRYPVAIFDDEQRDGFITSLDGLEVGGYTPIVQSLYEAAQYFRGGYAEYGSSANTVQKAHPDSLDDDKSSADEETVTTEGECFPGAHCDEYKALGATITENCRTLAATKSHTYERDGDICIGGYDEAGVCKAWNKITETVPAYPERQLCEYELESKVLNANYTYKSPIIGECQPNYIILLSDGEPDDGLLGSDSHIVDKASNLINTICSGTQDDGYCGPDLTDFLADNDLRGDLEDVQNVKTYTIGFANTGEGNKYLASLANLGEEEAEGEGFFSANDEKRLEQVFTEIIDDIAGQTSSLLPPTLSVDDATGFETSDRVFLPFFQPGYLPRWPGNLKRYRLQGTTLYDEDDPSKPVIVDGKISDEAQSAWSSEADGDSVRLGGTASMLGEGRTLKTDTTAGNSLIDFPFPKDALEEEDQADYENILKFAKGIDPETGLPRAAMGDILHSRPVLVSYAKGTDTDPLANKVVFVGTNEGYLHAFDASTGEEKFAFMPQALIKNLPTLYRNEMDTQHPYGMDGPLTVWRYDADDDGVIEAGDGDHVYLYAGMRRGGKNYYALNVTDPGKPKLMWTIKGGSGDFAMLGQTWSKPIVAKVDKALVPQAKEDKDEYVLIFGGGYDELHDEMECSEKDVSVADCPKASLQRSASTTGRGTDDSGRRVFMVGAEKGDLLWSAGTTALTSAKYSVHQNMTNAFAADLSVVDIDGNGVADRIYAADLGGRIFRIDLPDSDNNQVSEIKDLKAPQVSLLADLGGKDVVDNRRFFYEPDVSIVQDGIKSHVALVIGSGYRAHPLDKGENTAQDMIFKLKDRAVYTLLEKDVGLETGDLVNATSGEVKADDVINGWYYQLSRDNGEKVLAKAVTLNNTVYLTSFTPSDPPTDIQCTPARHRATIYTLTLETAGTVVRYKEGALQEEIPRASSIETSDILSEVSLVFSKGTGGEVEVHVMAGSGLTTRAVGSGVLPGLVKVYWEEDR